MNNYKLIKSLGNGSYGNIYLVSDHNKKEHVIKKINLNKNEEKMNNSENSKKYLFVVEKRLFLYSIFYLFVTFLLLLVEHF